MYQCFKDRFGTAGVVIGLMLLLALATTALPAPASASRLYGSPSAAFGPDGTAGTSFEHPAALAVDPASHDIYAADLARGSVEKFNPSHEPAEFSALSSTEISGFGFITSEPVNQLAIGSGGTIYVSDGYGALEAFQADGEAAEFSAGPGAGTNRIEAFAELCGIATDANGDIYTGDYSNGVHVFAPTGEELASFAVPTPCNLAVDSHGDVYVDHYPLSGEGVQKFTPSGGEYPPTASTTYESAGKLDPNPAYGIAVDPGNDELLVDEHTRIAAYSAAGTRTATFAGPGEGGQLSASEGLAVDGSSGTAYVSDAGGAHQVQVFPATVLPTVTTSSATAIEPTTATLNGEVDPEAIALEECTFEYGTTESYGETAQCEPDAAAIGSGSSFEAVAAQLSGLQPSTAYHFRLAAKNENGTEHGADRTLRTTGPPTIDSQSAHPGGRNAATIEALLNPSGFETHAWVEYGETSGYGSETTHQSLGESSEDQALSAELSGLQPGTTYHYRILAENSHGSLESKEDQTFTTEAALLIDSTSAAEVGTVAATVQAQINPLGAESFYRFEYLTEAESEADEEAGHDPFAGAARVPASDASVGSGVEDVAVSQRLQGLQSETAYRYRAVAHNSFGVVAGPARAFTTTAPVGAFTLPDNRAYEMVSPVDKNGGNIDGGTYVSTQIPEQASLDGETVTYGSSTAFAGAQSLLLTDQYLSRRGPEGWSTEAITPPEDISDLPDGHVQNNQSAVDQDPYQGFSEDLSVGYLQSGDPAPISADTPGYSPGYWMPYLRDLNAVRYRLLSVQTPPIQPPGAGDSAIPGLTTQFAGATPDGSHVVFAANDALTPDAISGEKNLYEWSESGLHLVSVLSDGKPVANASFGPHSSIYSNTSESRDFSNVISNDGSRVFWTGSDGNIYVREDGTTTAQVDAGVGGDGHFWTASSDGSRIFFTKTRHLYEYDLSTEQTTDLTPDGEVGGVVGASNDGSYVYYATEFSDHSGELYVYHRGSSTALAAIESPPPPYAFEESPWTAANINRIARVSPNGHYLAFQSRRSLTHYDNHNPAACPTEPANPEGRCMEVYLYNAASNALRCVSCNPTAALPVGESRLPTPEPNGILGGVDRGWVTPAYQQRYLLDNGELFFDSTDAILPPDTNGREDVYEYEPMGTGTCESGSQNGGCLGLISTGSSSSNSKFFDASASGRDVFFTTSEPLVRIDTDKLLDLYDAREGGGIAAQNTVPPAQCQGDACQTPPSAPNDATPGTLTLNGPGNEHPAVPRRPKHRRHRRRPHGRSRHLQHRRSTHIDHGGTR